MIKGAVESNQAVAELEVPVRRGKRPKGWDRRLENCHDLEPIDVHYAKRKRLLDIFGSAFLILLLSPVLLIIALIIKLQDRGPVLYRSERIGLCGVPFQFLKFRSMRVDADKRLDALLAQNEKEGPIFKIKHDPRITPIGRFLRKYSLDELPQLFNVFRGEMSLVGPRPPLRREVEKYDQNALQRLTVRPGITCFWQVMGRSNLSFDEWMALDNRYIREMGVFTDLKLLLMTPIAVIKGDGAY